MSDFTLRPDAKGARFQCNTDAARDYVATRFYMMADPIVDDAGVRAWIAMINKCGMTVQPGTDYVIREHQPSWAEDHDPVPDAAEMHYYVEYKDQGLRQAVTVTARSVGEALDIWGDNYPGDEVISCEPAVRLKACEDWAPTLVPSPIYDTDTGRCIGQLQPINPEAIAASPGIQDWSKPGGNTEVPR